MALAIHSVALLATVLALLYLGFVVQRTRRASFRQKET